MKVKFLLLVCCLLFASVTTGMCETNGPVFFVSPMIGGHIFDGNQDIDNHLTYGFGIGAEWNRQYGLESIFNYTNTESKPGGNDINVWGYRLGGYYNFLTFKNLVPYIGVGIGGNRVDQSSQANDHFIIDYDLGVKYFLNKSMALRCDLRNIVGYNRSYDNFLYTAGFSWFFPADKPVQPVVKEQKSIIRDQDGDGISDGLDQCENTPVGISVDARGCPSDADADGVADYLDNCPGTLAGVMVDKHGCEADVDKDGVPYDLDKCPDTPSGVTVDRQGCPLDTDNDGVYDYLDKCSGTLAGVPVDENGCWKINPLYFPANKSKVRSKSDKDLDRLVGIMTQNPGINIEIQGYTDNQGTVKYNEKLSLERAKTIKNYLTSKGIDAKRITAKGYGPSSPIATNDTPEGRALNRRVEINIK